MKFGLVMVCLLFLVNISASKASDIELVAHSAVYKMSLASMRSGSVTGVNGVMTYRFEDSCDGWITEYRTELFLSYSEEASVKSIWNLVTWETKDGRHYRFRERSSRNGITTNEVAGEAHLDIPEQDGQAKFTLPEDKQITLARNTLFPTEHTLRLLEHARGGDRLMEKILFDGTDMEQSSSVSAAIGKIVTANESTVDYSGNNNIDKELLAVPYWPVHLAFYPVTSNDPSPDYEVGLHYYENGISDHLLQSFGDFSLRGTLEELKKLPKPNC